MGIFSNDDEEWEAIKNEYREKKLEIEDWYRNDYPNLVGAECTSAPKFEYLTLEDISEAELDERGANGWELVNFASYTVGFGLGGNDRMNVHLRYVFKRPIELTEANRAGWSRIAELRERKAALANEIESRGFKAE